MFPVVKNLKKCFGELTNRQLANLVWHVENKTPICCGKTADMYTTIQGAG